MVLFDKIKIGISILSIFILVAIPIVKNSFYQTPIISRWETLTWEDFKGIPKPFSGWGAEINSNIFLEYDSLEKKYNAYAAQNNLRSWTKSSSFNALRHEQYHFNISEIHARKLNKYILDNPKSSPEDYYEKLYALRQELSKMQDKYDDDSDHSLIYDQQDLWEFRVDSLMAVYNLEDRFIIDPFSNGSVFFPANPTLSTFFADQTLNRAYVLGNRGLKLQLNSILSNTLIDFELLKRDIKNNFSFNVIDTSRLKYQVTYSKIDSTENAKFNYLLTFNGHHLIELMVKHRLKDSLGGYEKIKNSFFQSFTLQDQRDYWNTSSDDVKPQELSLSKALKKEDKAYDSGACTVRWFEKPYGFYGVPYQDSSSNIIIPYQFIVDSIQEIQYGLVKYGDDFIYSKPDSIFHLFTIPNDLVDPEISEFSIGYTLFKDSIEVCEQNYAQVIDVSSLFNSK